MDRYQVSTIVITIIVIFYCCSFSTTAQSTSEEERTEVELPKLDPSAIPENLEISKIEVPGVSKKKEDEQDQETEEGNGTFDLSFPGDNKVQSLDLFFERTYNTQPFKFKGIESRGIEFKFNGNYFLTFQKSEPPSEDSIWKTLWASFSDWNFHSRSYTFRFEGSTLGRSDIDKSGVDRFSIDNFGMGGYIEIEGDHTIAVDPHLHITLYPKWTPYSFVEIAVGGWAEVQQLGKALKCPQDLPQKTCRDYSRYYWGLHIL